jgi:hypothetical protein
MPKCIRCGRESTADEEWYGSWKYIVIERMSNNGESYIGDISPFGWLCNDKCVLDKKGEAGSKYMGLCPDCQLPSEVVGCKDNLQREGPRPIPDDKTRSYAEWLDNIDERIKFLERCRKEHYNEIHQHEHDIETLGGCLAAMEKRTAKLERELDRLWEVIRCKGEK